MRGGVIMGATVSTIMPAGVEMEKTNLKCICGEYANLHYMSKLGRLGEQSIIVHNVPVYVCHNCQDKFMTGADSKRFANRVRDAVNMRLEYIDF